MPHEGKANAAAVAMLAKIGGATLVAAVVGGLFLPYGAIVAPAVTVVGALFAGFTIWFFRDPTAATPGEPGLIVAPAHGLVDVVDETDATAPMKGRVRRISIFLSVFDVHVQQAPFAGEVLKVEHKPGKFLNAISADCANHNENVWIPIRPFERPDAVAGVRLIAGLIARRIIPWLEPGERIKRGDRIALIQFGSRVELLLPLSATVTVQTGTRVRGGETVVARWNS
jgi:phosphatidylserine decarboxylase